MLSDSKWDSPPSCCIYVVMWWIPIIHTFMSQGLSSRETDRQSTHPNSVVDRLSPCEPVLGHRPPIIRAADTEGEASVWCNVPVTRKLS